MPRTISLKELFDFLDRSVEESINKASMQDIGDALAEIVRTRTRLGYGVSKTGGSRQRLKSLSALYVEFRKESRASLSRFTRPGRSNLTYTGQMLDSLEAEARDGNVEIKATGTRPEGLKNIDLSEYVSQQGRPFLDVSNNELKQLTRILDEGLNQSLRRRLSR